MNDKTGSIVNDDGKENAAAMRNNGKINFATFWKMELQFYGKMICNFLEKCLAKNSHEKPRVSRKRYIPPSMGFDSSIHNKRFVKSYEPSPLQPSHIRIGRSFCGKKY